MDSLVDNNTLKPNRFSIGDYAVFGVMLTLSAATGVYYAFAGSKQSTTSEFLMGGRSMKLLPVSLSMFSSFVSAIALLGTSAETYTYGTQYWTFLFSLVFVMPAALFLYIPVFYKLGLTSAYEYLELRFNRLTRTLASMIFSLQTILYMAVVLYAPALALAQVTGIGVWTAVASVGIVCTFYTTLGGIRAVVLTDAFQAIIMLGSMFVIVFKGAEDVGGWHNVWNTSLQGNRIEVFNFDPNPLTRHTVWTMVIGGYFTWQAIYGVNQSMIQRYLALPTLKKAQGAVLLNLPCIWLIITLTTLAGLVVYTKYHDCDPLTINLIQAQDQLLPLFVMEVLGTIPCLPGLFVSGVFSGSLSTLSSGFNSLAAVTLEDLVKTYIKPDITEPWATRITKLLAVFYGVLTIALVAAVQHLGGILQACLSVWGMIGGPLLGVFSLGLFFPWANTKGSIVGLLSGLAISFWIGFGALVYRPQYPRLPVSISGCPTAFNESVLLFFNITLDAPDMTITTSETESGFSKLYALSYMWYSATGCFAVVLIGLLVSFISGANDPQTINPDLICPVFDILCPCLPEKTKKKLRFNLGNKYKIANGISDICRNTISQEATNLSNGNPSLNMPKILQEEQGTRV